MRREEWASSDVLDRIGEIMPPQVLRVIQLLEKIVLMIIRLELVKNRMSHLDLPDRDQAHRTELAKRLLG